MFSKRLKELRTEHNILQSELATAIDISGKTISSYELGKSEPNIETLIKLSRYFNVTVDYLIGASQHRSLENDVLSKTIPASDGFLTLLKAFSKSPVPGSSCTHLAILDLMSANAYFHQLIVLSALYVTRTDLSADALISMPPDVDQLTQVAPVSVKDVLVSRATESLRTLLSETRDSYWENK